ncbi:MAG: Spy/CpxP family protein refolding chaperone [Parahaliea sp.]
MKKRFVSKLAIAGLSASLLIPAFSQAEPEGPPRDHGDRVGHMAKKLELNDEQQLQIKAIFEKSHEAGESDHKRIIELKDELRDAKAFDAAATKAKTDEIGDITARMTYRMAETQNAVRAVLTEEQQAEMDKWTRQHDEKRGDRGDRHRDGKGAKDDKCDSRHPKHERRHD